MRSLVIPQPAAPSSGACHLHGHSVTGLKPPPRTEPALLQLPRPESGCLTPSTPPGLPLPREPPGQAVGEAPCQWAPSPQHLPHSQVRMASKSLAETRSTRALSEVSAGKQGAGPAQWSAPVTMEAPPDLEVVERHLHGFTVYRQFQVLTRATSWRRRTLSK